MTSQDTHDTRIDIPALLVRLPLFQELSAEQIAHLAAHTRAKRLPKGEMLFQRGDIAHGFYFIVFGQVKLAFPSSSGNEKVVEILGPRQSFGEAAVFAQRPYPVFAQALADSLLLFVPRDAIFELLETDNSFARNMLAGLAMRLHSLIMDVESYSLRSSAQRVIGYLLQHCPNEHCEGSIEIILPTSKQVIASRLNLTPETLSRILHDLTEARLIEMQGKHIKIGDLKRLREYEF
ncbi:MAG: Crp/Fnr family transcriptional regulator [Pseudomonadota bacterium]|uniref:Crp/Fnr family transcriptional regulator n=1 Tax=Sulfuricystis thermophila TaxID=2496847 RepID=UPI00103596A7|nr:Crp/Fnr family transcriptional regulator [Sulfuricystis thermophila]MDI6750566.1 Crp/Fnr family transcriptional regulator [Rhodocyclaceae bacterium]